MLKTTEIGSFFHLQVEERTSKICNSQEIENEFNFVLVCLMDCDNRANLYSSIAMSHKFHEFVKTTMEEEKIICIY